MAMDKLQFRYQVLSEYTAKKIEIQELLAYNQNKFIDVDLTTSISSSVAAEPHIDAWQQYIAQANTIAPFEVLKQVFIQLQFPIEAGISHTEAYQAATKRGKLPTENQSGVTLIQPQQLQLWLHQTLAGPIPVILVQNRQDFISLVQAIAYKNEPQPIPDSMGACIVQGYNNWRRIGQYRADWQRRNPEAQPSDWQAEFKRLIGHRELYQDRFIILSSAPYSNLSAEQLGLSTQAWQELSLNIRLEHECTHYLTRRWFGSMQNNLLDELIADYRGIVAAIGYYRADWFLAFMGLESYPQYRQGGRLENYPGKPPLSEGAFRVLQTLVKQAAQHLQTFDRQYRLSSLSRSEEIAIFIGLIQLTLEELASNRAVSLLADAVEHLNEQLKLLQLYQSPLKTPLGR